MSVTKICNREPSPVGLNSGTCIDAYMRWGGFG